MKKLLTYILTVVLMLPCLKACSNGVMNGARFYNGKVLKEFQIMDFPKPQGTEDVYAPTNSQLYFNRTAEGFEEYAEQLYTYLVEKDFAYFGYRGDVISTFFGGAPTYEFYLSSELSEHQYLVDRNGRKFDNCYVFVFSNELSGDSLIHECAIELIYRPDDEEYNTHLCIYYDKNVFTGYTLITDNTPEHEHTREMRSNEYAHWYVYTCGCETPENSAKHGDIDGDFLCDDCGYDMNEHEHTYEYNHNDYGHCWSYTCGCMTPPNFAQHFDGDGDGKCDEDSCGYDMSE